MDFYQRLQQLTPEKYQALAASFAKIGDPREIFAYIASMPVICEEGKNIFSMEYEVRFDRRFLVLCYKKTISLFPTDRIRTFYFCACEALYCTYYVGINQSFRFTIGPKSAHRLFTLLKAACPNFFSPISNVNRFKLYENVTADIDGRRILITQPRLFRQPKLTEIPLAGIRSCYQTYSSDPECNFCYLHLKMQNGTEEKIRLYGEDVAFSIAQRLKSYLPNLAYEFFQNC